jgi:ADP-ribose pyrophosphatase YjhB (NUDIX family)
MATPRRADVRQSTAADAQRVGCDDAVGEISTPEPTDNVGPVSRRPPPSRQDLIRWAEALSGIARTGLGFTQSLYERERFDEVLAVAGDIRAAAQADAEFDAEHYVDEWMKGVGEGVAGYITPKVAVGAVVHNDAGEILLVQRADSGIWLYPTGWADVGYSASEIAVKEVHEETGIECEPVRLLALLDGLRLGFTTVPLYSLVFLCRAMGGELAAHPLETRGVGWFAPDAMPQPLAGADQWLAHANRAIAGEDVGVLYDEPRAHPWEPG